MSVLPLRRRTSSSSQAVKYTPCSNGDRSDDDELNDISVLSTNGKDPGGAENGVYDREGDDLSVGMSDNLTLSHDGDSMDNDLHHSHIVTANGPRMLPGPGSSPSPGTPRGDRTKLIGARLSSSGKINLSSPVYTGKVIEQRARTRSSSKQSLIDIVNRVTGRKNLSYSKEEVAFLNKARSNDTMSSHNVHNVNVRKIRRKELHEKFGGKKKLESIETMTNVTVKEGCKWTFVFDPAGRLAYWWSLVISLAFLYNFWVIIYRSAFDEIREETVAIWFTLDYFADLLYMMDIAFHFRTGYLEDGVLQTDSTKLRIHYMNTTIFYIDLLCLLPLDFLYLSAGFQSIFRFFRLVKIYRFWNFLDRTERHTNYPNTIRSSKVLHYLLAIFHWNASLIHLVMPNISNSNYEQNYLIVDRNSTVQEKEVVFVYLNSLYWSVLTLTTIGELPRPERKEEYLFVIFELVASLLLFATVLGHIANIVASVSASRKEFQAKLDGVKTYMSLRRVPLHLQDRVIKWFDYLWISNKSSDENKTLKLLPEKLKAEIAIHVHLDTLKRVDIFQNTEAGFLCELVLRLKPVLFSPGDYICRKGEVGKEMYIVNRGRLQVVADNGKTVLATLKPGSYFGEISILNMGTAGNRRTASVRSVGYSDLFCLSKKDLWDVLKEYPAARVKLESIAVKRLEKYKKAPLEKAAIARSKSTPGLIESAGKVPLQAMVVSRHYTPPHTTSSYGQSSKDCQCSGSLGSNESTRSDSDNNGQGCPVHRNALREGSATPDKPDETESCSFNQRHNNMLPQLNTGLSKSRTQSSMASETTSRRSPDRGTVSPPMSPVSTTSLPQSHPMAVPPCVPNLSISPSANDGVTHNPPFTSTPYAAYTQMNVSQTLLTPHPYQGSISVSPCPSAGSSYPPSSPNPIMYSQLSPIPQGSPIPTNNLAITPTPTSGGHTLFPFNNISPSPNMAASMTSLSRDQSRDMSQDILLQEIQRLRDRLVTLETENTTMSIKLNQQQWEVEHRLAEIEMHICGSDSLSNGEDENSNSKMEPVNKESII
ncbi:unnamed protein product [Owenia fusiformis]|uniref:Uncharacterized protein n=1 Tax=Owenia fusiformis TaxID=6347 RepID=A0A8J1UV86_OWEFU|nr:unnamed protein product [Owenia fusiformis]